MEEKNNQTEQSETEQSETEHSSTELGEGDNEKDAQSQLDPKKVVIGMTGGIDSAVAAFLLKKQGFQCIGVSIVLLEEENLRERIIAFDKANKEEESDIFKKKDKGKFEIEEKDKLKFLDSCCSVKNLQRVKLICDEIGVQFFAVNACFEYREQILEPVIVSRLSGEKYTPCIACNVIKLDILIQKANLLGAKYIATGHYAKIYKNEKLACYQMFVSNDEENDQSYLISNIGQAHMSRLLLPLSDLRRIDTEKINEKFNLHGERIRDSKQICFSSGDISYLVEATTHHSLRASGQIIVKKTDATMGEHLGIHKFWVGQMEVRAKSGIGQHNIEKDMVVISIDTRGTVYLGGKDDLCYEGCGIEKVMLTPFIDKTRPNDICVKMGVTDRKIAATIKFKSLDCATIDFHGRVCGLVKGQHLAFYDVADKGGKLIGSAVISYLGDMMAVDRIELADGGASAGRRKKEEDGQTTIQKKSEPYF